LGGCPAVVSKASIIPLSCSLSPPCSFNIISYASARRRKEAVTFSGVGAECGFWIVSSSPYASLTVE
jgi:hypothetical protein